MGFFHPRVYSFVFLFLFFPLSAFCFGMADQALELNARHVLCPNPPFFLFIFIILSSFGTSLIWHIVVFYGRILQYVLTFTLVVPPLLLGRSLYFRFSSQSFIISSACYIMSSAINGDGVHRLRVLWLR